MMDFTSNTTTCSVRLKVAMEHMDTAVSTVLQEMNSLACQELHRGINAGRLKITQTALWLHTETAPPWLAPLNGIIRSVHICIFYELDWK